MWNNCGEKNVFNIAQLTFVFKTCNPSHKRKYKNVYFTSFLYPLFFLKKALSGELLSWFVCCAVVSKWLLFRQRRALCCKMLLRHNWVRLVLLGGRVRRRLEPRCSHDSASILSPARGALDRKRALLTASAPQENNRTEREGTFIRRVPYRSPVAELTRPGNDTNPRALDGCQASSSALLHPASPYKVIGIPPHALCYSALYLG